MNCPPTGGCKKLCPKVRKTRARPPPADIATQPYPAPEKEYGPLARKLKRLQEPENNAVNSAVNSAANSD
jgi:hypothetical protein